MKKFKRLFQRLAPTGIIYTGIIAAAALAFGLIEHQPVIRSLYWAVVTGFTIGFGDVLPSGNTGMLLCIIYIPASAITYLILGAHIVGVVLDNRNEFTLNKQKELFAEVQALVDHFGIQVDYNKDHISCDDDEEQ